MSDWDRTFLGMRMQQSVGIVLALNSLFEMLKPRRIIELGTGYGGLTVCLGIWGYTHLTPVYSFDATPRHWSLGTMLAVLGVRLIREDIFGYEEAIARLVQRHGITLLLCDNGDKKREVNTFAPYLKMGDTIMLHDYSADGSVSHEVEYADIQATCVRCGLVPIMPEEFRPFNWGVFRKDGKSDEG